MRNPYWTDFQLIDGIDGFHGKVVEHGSIETIKKGSTWLAVAAISAVGGFFAYSGFKSNIAEMEASRINRQLDDTLYPAKVHADVQSTLGLPRDIIRGVTLTGLGKCSLYIPSDDSGKLKLHDSNLGSEIVHTHYAEYTGTSRKKPRTVAISPGEKMPKGYDYAPADIDELTEMSADCRHKGVTITP